MNQDIKIIFYVTLFILFVGGTLKHDRKLHPKQKSEKISKQK